MLNLKVYQYWYVVNCTMSFTNLHLKLVEFTLVFSSYYRVVQACQDSAYTAMRCMALFR